MTTKNGKLDVLVSAVSFLGGDIPDIEPLLVGLSERMSADYHEYEIILICDVRQEAMLERLEALILRIPKVRLIVLASPVSEEVGIASGMENAIGDFIVNLNLTRDPPDMIRTGVELCMGGSDIVVGVTKLPESMPYRIGSRVFRALFARTVGYVYPRKGTTFLIMSRRSVNAVTRVRKFDHRLIARIYGSGYRIQPMPYRALKEQGIGAYGKKNFRGGVNAAYQTIIFNSLKPLRIMNLLGLVGSLLAFLSALYSIIVNIVKSHVQEGWTTLVLLISGMFFILFMVLSVLGEYVARLIEERDPGSDYDVLYENHSGSMIDTKRKNVYKDSVAEETNWAQTGRDR